MCAALNRLSGIEVELATTDADGAGSRLESSALPSGFVTHLFPRTFSERWKFSAPLWSWLRGHCKDYELVHIHALWSFSSWAAGAAAYRGRVPYIVRPAGMLSAYTWSRRLGARHLYWMGCERRTVRRACAFHATSEAEAAECRSVHPGARAVVIPNGVDSEAWNLQPDDSLLRRQCGPNAADRPILLFLSRIHPKKGITDLLLPAFAQLKDDVFLAIAGGADPHETGYVERVRGEVGRLGLGNRVAMLGPVPASQRWHFFDGAAALVLPSHSENFGIVVAEAMARGCPVVVSDAVQAFEHVRSAGAGLVVPLDCDSLARALSRVVNDREARAQFGRAGRDYAALHFDWDRIAGKILEMYEACLSRATAHT
jgi:glycosyltransferase involved in cell wall biosynthesis